MDKSVDPYQTKIGSTNYDLPVALVTLLKEDAGDEQFFTLYKSG